MGYLEGIYYDINNTHYMSVIESKIEILNDNSLIIEGYITDDNKYLIIREVYKEGEEITETIVTSDQVDFDEDYNMYVSLSKIKLDHRKPKVVKKEDFKNYLQGKITYFEFVGYEEFDNGYCFNDTLKVTLSDILAQLNSIDTIYDFDFEAYLEASHFDNELDKYLRQGHILADDIFFQNETHLVAKILKILVDIKDDNYIYSLDLVKSSLKDEVKYFNSNESKNRSYLVKSFFVETYSQEANYYLYNQIPNLLSTYKEYAYYLIDQDDELAIKAIAYLDYEGAPFWNKNYTEAKDLLEKLLQKGDMDAANTLGYLYYYHNPYDTKADYNKAFYYFSIGALGNNDESKYKLADCFLNGYGCKQNQKIAYKLLNELFLKTRNEFRSGNFITKFADVAYRMAKIDYETYVKENDESMLDVAKYEISEALYAIRKRMNTIDYIGDSEVYENIYDLYSNFEFENVTNEIQIDNIKTLGLILLDVREKDIDCKYEFYSSNAGEIYLRIYLPNKSDKYIFQTFNNFGKAILTKELEIKGYSNDVINQKGKLKDLHFDCFTNDEGDFVIDITDKYKDIYIFAPSLIVAKELTNLGSSHKVALILANNQKLSENLPFIIIADGFDLKPNDRVKIAVNKGRETMEVSVYKVINMFESELPFEYKKMDRVIEKIDNLIN